LRNAPTSGYGRDRHGARCSSTRWHLTSEAPYSWALDRLASPSRDPIDDDGSAGLADLFATCLGGNDGLEVGPDGSVSFADTYDSDVWGFAADGTRRLLIATANEFGDR
jgi:hypothetical protein